MPVAPPSTSMGVVGALAGPRVSRTAARSAPSTAAASGAGPGGIRSSAARTASSVVPAASGAGGVVMTRTGQTARKRGSQRLCSATVKMAATVPASDARPSSSSPRSRSRSRSSSSSSSSSRSRSPRSPRRQRRYDSGERKSKRQKKKKKTKTKKKHTRKDETTAKSAGTTVVARAAALPSVPLSRAPPPVEEDPPPAPRRVVGAQRREDYEREQSVVRRVLDPATGRVRYVARGLGAERGDRGAYSRARLVKGSGEILESIVSRDEARQLNRLATTTDGITYQAVMMARALQSPPPSSSFP
jgi:hypothetical protein